MASALFNVGIFAGELFAPMVAGLLAQYYSFETAGFYLSVVLLTVALLYVPVVFLKTNERDSLMKSYLSKKLSVLI
jgi:MFS family permease